MSHRSSTFGLIAGALLVAASPCAPAWAADLDYGFGNAPPPIAESKVEFGSGWYVRGDIGATRLPNVKPISYGDLAAPGLTIGPGNKLGYTASLGGGYQFSRWLRADPTFDVNDPVKKLDHERKYILSDSIYYDAKGNRGETNGACIGTDTAHLTNFDVLVNGYVDLGTWSILTPYVGAGAGLAFGHYTTSATYVQGANGLPYNVTFTDPQTGAVYYNNYDRHYSANYYNFAFALMAGVGIDIYPHTKLDINYRYLHIGNVLGSELYQHQVRAGLRYMIDN